MIRFFKNLVLETRLAIAKLRRLSDDRKIDKLLRHASREAAAFRFERTPEGLWMPRLGLIIGGVFKNARRGRGQEYWGPWALDPNTFTNEGLNYVLNSALGAQSAISLFYLSPFSGNVTPDGTWTGANFITNSTEFLLYTPSTRPLWDLTGNAPTSTEVLGNDGHEAVITFSAGGPFNLYGLGLLSHSAKSDNTGKCVAATRFASSRLNQASGDQLAFGYDVTAADAG